MSELIKMIVLGSNYLVFGIHGWFSPFILLKMSYKDGAIKSSSHLICNVVDFIITLLYYISSFGDGITIHNAFWTVMIGIII